MTNPLWYLNSSSELLMLYVRYPQSVRTRDLLGGRGKCPTMSQAALTGRAGKAFIDRPDDATRPVADHQKRIAEPFGARIPEGRPHGLDALFEPAINR
jgi:hypothetical protein